MKNPFKFLMPKAAEEKPPKPPSKQVVIDPYLGSTRGAKIANSASNLTSLDLSSFPRQAGSMNEVIKTLVLSSPDLSHAVESKIKTAISLRYTAIAYDGIGKINPKGTELLQTFLYQMNYGSVDYTKFQQARDLRSISSSLLLDNFRYGGMSAELVCGSMKLPAFIKPFSFRRVEWADDVTETYPLYKGKTGTVPLNYPTIFVSNTLRDLESPYADSPLQSVIQACLWDAEFANALRRAATKNLLQRLKVTIDSERFLKTLPFETQSDPEELKVRMNSLKDSLEEQLSRLEPDDSLVIFDNLSVDTIQDANRSEDRSITVLHDLINGRISSGAKILPAIIGRGESSNAASTESMLFLKHIAAAQLELNTFFSRMLTLALRLFGSESFAVFTFDEANLRPELELSAFRSQRQSTVLEQLSYGFISDEEASIMITGSLPGPDYKKLSGTQFRVSNSASENPYSNTSVDDASSSKPDATKSQKDSKAPSKGVIGVKK